MRWITSGIAILAGVMGFTTVAVAGNRGLSPIVIQADTSGAGTTPQPNYILKYCKETESGGDPRSAMHAVSPAGMLAVYLERYKGAQFIDLAEIKNITLLEGSKHGELVSQTSRGLVGYWYDPEPEYVGNDRAVFMAEYQGVRYKIVVELHVFSIVMENMPSSCPPPKLIKVNKPASGNSGYDLNSISVTLGALEGGALGQTNANGIILDSNAAGYNWFIDTTPGQNEEWLPTSNPNEWVAKAGSDAAGKMDMLSVLLHEYGHALGIDHSPKGSCSNCFSSPIQFPPASLAIKQKRPELFSRRAGRNECGRR